MRTINRKETQKLNKEVWELICLSFETSSAVLYLISFTVTEKYEDI